MFCPFLGFDVGAEAVTNGHHLPELREVCGGTVRVGVRAAELAGQTCGGHFYWWV